MNSSKQNARRGLTLIELMMVVAILVILAAIAVPAMRPAMEGRPVREASRMTAAYLSSAANRARETGRPAGVLFERLDRQCQCSVVLRQVEIPPPYAGDTEDTVAQLQVNPTNGVITATLPRGFVSPGIFRVGDAVQFNLQGPLYTITGGAGVDANGFISSFPISVALQSGAAVNVPWPVAPSPPGPPSGVPFQIFRQAVPAAVAPLRLPAGTVIDLSASGTDSPIPLASGGFVPAFIPFDANDRSPVMVLFSPRGDVDRIYFRNTALRVTEPIYFLVGKWSRMPAAVGGGALAEDGLLNWQDATNLWVGINARTGLVAAAPMFADTAASGTNLMAPSNLGISRQYARQFQGMGGR